MSRIQPVDRTNTNAETQQLLTSVEKKLGMLPNMVAAMAQSLPTVKAYLGFSQSIAGGSISPKLREQIAIAVGASNGCNYCLAAHSAIASSLGVSDCEVEDARTANSTDRNTEAVLQFARAVAETRGGVSDEEIAKIRSVGFGDAEITEIIGHVALNTFTNFFNRAADTEIDFPPVPEAACK